MARFRDISLCVLSMVQLLLPVQTDAQALNGDALERWFESDELETPYEDRGGDGELQFLQPAPDQKIPFSQTNIHLTNTSHTDGWVSIEQCHEGLDPVPDAEVVYRFKQMRGLRVTKVENIKSVWIDGQSVQLKDVAKQARLCLAFDAHSLLRREGGRYLLRYGPFQHRFLDSYFPMHILLTVDYSQSPLALAAVTPLATEGYRLEQTAQRFSADAWFRGRLTIELQFQFTPRRRQR
ncbi:hypothetical protein BOW53_07535 [Solemya pervernicosa gill symbiont]|uniref:Uncharacterized protein n=1 Tax=Solemya pervernicosa gill symbiont TaxID=642797 RepID=A0A1T2L610_9GAMM|nr:hypothetical protein [Solemya pervernicosa gill symbiont]OOZ40492.1 hypothetical protein BOW53_07535 [Solemya pervernicosa gill symbiont]